MTAYIKGSVLPGIIDGGEWAACFGLSWTEMMLYDQAGQRRMIRPGGQFVRKVCGTMGVASARSEIMAYFLSTDAEWLFMVDTDMGFAPDTVDRMVSSAQDNGTGVLGGLCFAQKVDTDLATPDFHGIRYRITPTLYTYAEIEDTGERGFRPIHRYQRDAYQGAAGTGAALLLVHREVAAAVGAEPFMPLTDPLAGGNGTPRTFSEDLSFCVRVQAAGHTIGVDTAIKSTHFKGGIFLDETAYAMQQETLTQAKGHAIAREAETVMNGGAR